MGLCGKKSAGSKGSQFAPSTQHPNVPYGGLPAERFPEVFDNFKNELQSRMSGEYPQIDNGSGPKKTIYPGKELRYDREKPCESNGHPNDQFQAYSVQANINGKHPEVRRLAKNANGQHRAPQQSRPGEPPTFGGSTIASVNLQQNTGRRITPQRVRYAISHSAEHAESLFVLDRKVNVDTVPASKRQYGAVYHNNPYKEWPDRKDSRNAYHDCKDNGTLPPQSQRYDPKARSYVYKNGQYYECKY